MNYLDFYLDLIYYIVIVSFVVRVIVKDFLMLLFFFMLGLYSIVIVINNGGKVWCEDDKRNFVNFGKYSSFCWIKSYKFKSWCLGKFVVFCFL